MLLLPARSFDDIPIKNRQLAQLITIKTMKMACIHKFSADLNLSYVDWEVKTLFIGTFNPGWSSCQNNNAKWFYGRTQRNEFWSILPMVHDEQSLLDGDRDIWIQFCRKHGIAITDIIRSLKNADESSPVIRDIICKFKDEDFGNFDLELIDIPSVLHKHNSIQQICLTRQTLGGVWANCFNDTFKWVEKNPQRMVRVRFLRSPSRGARRGVVGRFSDFVSQKWVEQGYLKFL